MTTYVIQQRSVITEGDTQPHVIEYRHQPADLSTATAAELVAWSMITRGEVMRTEATVTALTAELDGTFRGTIEGAVTYLPPGAYYVQAVLDLPGGTVARVPGYGFNLSVSPGPGDAVDTGTASTSELAFDVTLPGHTFVLLDPVRQEDDGDWVQSSTADPLSTEAIVVGVDGDTVTLQSSGAATFVGGHGLGSLGKWYLGSGSPAIQYGPPASGKIEQLFGAVTAEVVVISIGPAGGF